MNHESHTNWVIAYLVLPMLPLAFYTIIKCSILLFYKNADFTIFHIVETIIISLNYIGIAFSNLLLSLYIRNMLSNCKPTLINKDKEHEYSTYSIVFLITGFLSLLFFGLIVALDIIIKQSNSTDYDNLKTAVCLLIIIVCFITLHNALNAQAHFGFKSRLNI